MKVFAFFLALLTPVVSSSAICNEGDIGIGFTQLCNIGNFVGQATCGGITGVIFDSDCKSIDQTQTSYLCSDVWSKGAEVVCEDSIPTKARIGGTWYECRAVSGKEGSCATGPFVYASAQVCCSPT